MFTLFASGKLTEGAHAVFTGGFSDSSEELMEVSSFLTEIFETFPGCVELS